MMIVVDQSGADTGLRVTKITAGLAREQLEEALRELDEQVEAIELQLAYRGVEVNMPKIKSTGSKPPIKSTGGKK